MLPATAAEPSRFRFWPFGGDRAQDAELTGNSLSPNARVTGAPKSAANALPSQSTTGSVPRDTLPEQRWMFNSPMSRVSWPSINLPGFSTRRPNLPRPNLPTPQLFSRESTDYDTRNAWMPKSPDQASPTPLRGMQQGAQRFGQRTRTAWRKTVDALTPGGAPTASDPRVAARDEKPPFWKRLGGTKQPQKQGSQTVTEMLSQERIDF
jgi:hypothetical protein